MNVSKIRYISGHCINTYFVIEFERYITLQKLDVGLIRMRVSCTLLLEWSKFKTNEKLFRSQNVF